MRFELVAERDERRSLNGYVNPAGVYRYEIIAATQDLAEMQARAILGEDGIKYGWSLYPTSS